MRASGRGFAATVAVAALLACTAPPALAGSIPGDAAEAAGAGFPAKIDRALKDLAAADRFAGVVLIAKGDRVVFQGAYGQASREYDRPNTVSTRFSLASAGKMFTAVALASLVEQGRVGWDDPIGKYLDASWVDPEIGRKVKVAQLLDHTSGLSDYFTPAYFDASKSRFKTIDDFKPLVAGAKLEFEPGTNWRYSNAAFLMAGAIIEKVTGGTYDAWLDQAIFKPAGMTGTAMLDLEAVNHDYAQGYAKFPRKPPEGSKGPPPGNDNFRLVTAKLAEIQVERDAGGYDVRNNILMHVAKGGPAGGGFSTAPDLLRFLDAFTAGRLVKPETVKRLTAAHPGSPAYGYGFQMMDGGFGHTGGFPGIGTAVLTYPDGWRLIVLSNLDGGSAAATAALIHMGEGR